MFGAIRVPSRGGVTADKAAAAMIRGLYFSEQACTTQASRTALARCKSCDWKEAAGKVASPRPLVLVGDAVGLQLGGRRRPGAESEGPSSPLASSVAAGVAACAEGTERGAEAADGGSRTRLAGGGEAKGTGVAVRDWMALAAGDAEGARGSGGGEKGVRGDPIPIGSLSCRGVSRPRGTEASFSCTSASCWRSAHSHAKAVGGTKSHDRRCKKLYQNTNTQSVGSQ